MDIRQCRMCDGLFQYIGNPICMNCMDELDRMFIKVREYLHDHSEADVAEVSEKTGVDQKYILKFLKEERLSLSGPSGLLVCEQCKKPIETGRFCTSCREVFNQAFAPKTEPQKAKPKEEPPLSKKKGGKMHLDIGG
ncbi:MAG: MerR family transcriptional regulator [Christensenellales bacterium]|jgi:flagellar operon protein (TIGR03826 family)